MRPCLHGETAPRLRERTQHDDAEISSLNGPVRDASIN
jgi:hypothetical protein